MVLSEVHGVSEQSQQPERRAAVLPRIREAVRLDGALIYVDEAVEITAEDFDRMAARLRKEFPREDRT